MVGIFPVVVVDPVGHVGALLNFRHGDAGADGVEEARRDVEDVALLHWHFPADLQNGLVLDALAEFVLGYLVLQAIIQICARLAIQHIPHLSLATFMFLFLGKCIARVHLYGQGLPGFDDFNEQGNVLQALVEPGEHPVFGTPDVLFSDGCQLLWLCGLHAWHPPFSF